MQSLYIHVPFCAKVCHYCDFSVLSAPERLYEDYLNLLQSEMRVMFKKFPSFATNSKTLYFGGGTPSVLNVKQQDRIFSALSLHGLNTPSLLEFSMEVNPESCFDDRIENAVAHGANRFSLGLQTFQEDLLLRIGRSHDVQTGLIALNKLIAWKAHGVSLSADLMFNLPGQTLAHFISDVCFLSEQNLDHVSFYGLNVSPHTVLGSRVRRGFERIEEADYEPMYLGGVDALLKAGFERYEVSNFAKPGKESIHNKNYWSGGSYLGLGPGAHSFVDQVRFFAPEKYTAWREWVLSGCPESTMEFDPIGKEERLTEKIWLSLRMAEGLDLMKLKKEESILIPEKAIQPWIDKKMLIRVGDHLRLQGRGWVFMDSIIEDFLVRNIPV